MGEQGLPAVAVERDQRIPEVGRLPWESRDPCLMPSVERVRQGAVLQARRLGAETGALQIEFQASVLSVAVERLQAERMQRRHEGDVRMLAQRVAKRERPMRRQFRHQPVGNRLQALVFLRLGRRLGLRRHARLVMLSPSGGGPRRAVLAFGFGLRLDRQFVLRPDVAPLDTQASRAVDADESAGAADLFGIERNRAIVEGGERRLDLAEPLIDLLGELVGLRIGFLQPVHLGLQGVARGLLLLGERDLLAAKLPQAIGVAVGEVGRDLDPLPALGADRLGSIFELVRRPAGRASATSCSQPPSSPWNRSRMIDAAGVRHRRRRRRTGRACRRRGRRLRSACAG